MSDFGYRLKTFRLRLGREWTQERLGNKVEVSRNTVSNWESGNYLPSRDMVLRLAQHLVLSPLERDQLLLAANYPLDRQKEEAEQIMPMYIADAKVEHMVVGNLHIKNDSPHQTRDFGRSDYYARISLSPNYVFRSKVYREVRDLLLKTDVARGALASAVGYLSPIVLHGVGGGGKSVLARALCEDEMIRAAFPEGILWTTLGQEPDLLLKIDAWVKQLGGIIREPAPTLEQVKEVLAQQLRERRCLLIVDDVWLYNHVEAFRVGGSSCRLLLTTRKAEIADKLGALVYHIPVMEAEEAIELLEKWAHPALLETPHQLKVQIVKRLSFLPLAIKLAGPQLRDAEPLIWLKDFHINDLEYQDIEHPHDSLRMAFELSMRELKEQDQHLYAALAIFKEDETIPFVAISHLWYALTEFDEKTIRKRLNNLVSQALVDHAPDRESIQLHDLLRDFLAQKLGNQARAIHQMLLNAYRQLWQGSGWHTIPDDGYLYDHLAFHLCQAGRIDELKELFTTQEWLQVRVPQKQYTYDGYLADLSLAWQQAEAKTRSDIGRNVYPSAFSECIRYALIQAGVHSLVGRYIPELVAQAVAKGVWKIERAISVLEKMLDPEKRVKMSIVLLQKIELPLAYQQKIHNLALEALEQFSWLENTAEALAVLSPLLPEEHKSQILNRVLKAALQEEREVVRARVVMVLVPQFPEEQRKIMLEQAWKIALSIKDEQWEGEYFPDQSDLLESLFPYLSGELLEQALKDAFLLENHHRAALLTALSPQLSGELLERALNIASQIEDGKHQANALVALVPQLPEQRRRLVLQRILNLLSQIEDRFEDRSTRPWVLKCLGPQLSGELVEQAWEIVLQIENDWERQEALMALAPWLPRSLLEQALQATLQLKRRGDIVLEALAPRLPGELLEQALDMVLQIEDIWDREEAQRGTLVALAPRLSGELLERALNIALQIQDVELQAYVLMSLAPQFSEKQRRPILEQALQVALQIEYGEGQAWVLMDLAPQFPEEQRRPILERALQATLQIEYAGFVKVLEVLVPQLSENLLEQALQAGKQMQDEWRQTELVVVLAPHLSGELLEQALDTALQIKDEEKQTKALVALASQLPKELLERALEIPDLMGIAEERAKLLVTLAPQMLGKRRSMILKRAVEDALQIQDAREKTQVLVALARQLLKEEAVEVLQQIKEGWWQVKVLEKLAPQLSGDLLKQALEIVMQIEDEPSRAEALATLAPQLPEKLLELALEDAMLMHDMRGRSQGLRALAPWVPKEQRNLVLEQAWQAALEIQDEEFDIETRTQELQTIAAQLPRELLQQALEDASQTNDIWDQVEGIRALAPRLDGELLEQAVQFALQVQDAWVQARGLITLAPQIPEVGREAILQQALQSIQQIQNVFAQAQELRELIPQLSGELPEQALQVIQLMDIESERNILLAILAPQIPELQRRFTLEKALESALYHGDLWIHKRVLAAFAPLISEADYKLVLEQSVQSALQMDYVVGRDYILNILAPQLSEELLWQALQDALRIKDQWEQSQVLKILLPEVSKERRQLVLHQALETIQQIKGEEERLRILTVYLPFISDHVSVLQQARQALVDLLSKLRYRSWQDFSHSSLFDIISAHSIFSSETLSEIADALIEISGWQWL